MSIGFSSYQLVLGANPRIANLMMAKPLQLEGTATGETVAMHLNTLQNARKIFIEFENCEKIRRAFCSNIRSKLEKYETGDVVY